MSQLTVQAEKYDTRLAIILALIVAIMPFSLDTYLPAIPAIARDLITDIHLIEKTLGIFLFSAAIGQLVGGPLSDTKGRKPIALIGLGIYSVGSLSIYLSTTVEQLLFLRAIQAFGAGMASVTVSAMVRDIYSGAQAARFYALIGIIMMIAPLISPLVGAILLEQLGWRAIFIFLFGYGILMLMLTSLKVQETNNHRQKLEQKFISRLIQSYLMVFKKKKALGFLFFQSFSFCSMFAFLTESPFVYMEIFGIAPSEYPFYFAVNIITMAIFNRITAYKLKNSDPMSLYKIGIAVQLLSNTILFSCAAAGILTLPIAIATIMFSVGSQGLIVANSMALYMEYFDENSGSANAIMGTTQYLLAGTVGIITTILHDGTFIPMTLMMFLSTLTGLLLLYYFTLRQAP